MENITSTQIALAGFRSFEAQPMSDGSVSFFGCAKINGQLYFATIKVTYREDGSPAIGLGNYKFETMTGKAARGAANIQLEELMDNAKETALEWARTANAPVASEGQEIIHARADDNSPSFDTRPKRMTPRP